MALAPKSMSIHSAVETSARKMRKGHTTVRIEKADGGFITHTGKDGEYPDKKKVHAALPSVLKHLKNCYLPDKADGEEKME